MSGGGSALPRHRWVWSTDGCFAACSSCGQRARKKPGVGDGYRGSTRIELWRATGEWTKPVPGSGCTAPKIRTEGRSDNPRPKPRLWDEFTVTVAVGAGADADDNKIQVCGLCGNSGIVNTLPTARLYDTPCGYRGPCICPNGRQRKRLRMKEKTTP